MHTDVAQRLSRILILLLFSPLLVGGQETPRLSPKEFLDQYLVAVQEVNTQKAAPLVRDQRDHADLAATLLLGEGVQAYWRADYNTALRVSMTALELYQQLGERQGEGRTLNSIGAISRDTGDDAQALRYYQEALTIAREIGDKAGEEAILENMGNLYATREQWAEAVAWNKQAIDFVEKLRGNASDSEAKESFFERHLSLYPHTVKLFLQLNAPAEAFVYAERSKARSFLELLYEASIGVTKGMNPALIDEENRLYGTLFEIRKALQQPLTEAQRATLMAEHRTREQELAVLKQEIRSANPRHAELKYPQPVTVDHVQRDVLRAGDVLVEYLVGEEEVYVFIIGKAGVETHTLQIRKTDLSAQVARLIAPFQAGSFKEWHRGLAYNLYQILFQPIEKKIAEANQEQAIRTLIIIPDGVLYYLPFEMLIARGGNGTRYFVDRYTISYAPSASVLKPDILHPQRPHPYAKDLLALVPFGNEQEARTGQVAVASTDPLLLPDSLRTRLSSWELLPNSAAEVNAISRLYTQALIKMDTEATKAYFKGHATGTRYLHLATHGYLDAASPMYSGLLFSDGMLQTYEIFNMAIDAELVTLSACQTGLGRLKGGEGLVGISRAFLFAGSPSVIASLWSVADQATAAFMTQFYRNLNRGMSKAEALREAKRR